MALSYVTIPEIENISGSKLPSTNLTAIAEDAEREVRSYLTAKDVTSISGDAVKTATLKLCRAGILQYNYDTGTLTKSDGAGGTTYQDSSGREALAMIQNLQRSAYEILDQYAASQSTAGSQSNLVCKVNGRC